MRKNVRPRERRFQRCLLGCVHVRPRRPPGMRLLCSFCCEWHSGSAWCWCSCPAVLPRAVPSVSDVGAANAISAASATVSDLRGFCSRQPDACTVGSQVATALGYKAQAGAKMLYEALTEALAPRETGSVASGATRGASAAKSGSDVSPPDRGSQNTLTLDGSHSCLARSAAAQGRQALRLVERHAPLGASPAATIGSAAAPMRAETSTFAAGRSI